MTTATRARKPAKPTEITSACIYHCTDRQSGEIFYLVQSDTKPGTFYAVRWDESRACWSCQCDSRRPCKHERAVNEVQIAKRELLAEQNAREKKMSDFVLMHIDGIQLNEAGKMHHFIPAEKLPVPARQHEDWSSPDAPIYTSDQPATTIPDDDMIAHVADSIRSGEFVDPTSCRYCGSLCKGGVCMDCLDIAA